MSEPNVYWAGTPNYTEGNYGILALFPHWTCGNFDASVSTLQNPDRQASAHYVIENDKVAQLVSETDSAWHCGNHYYNMRSISYELVGWPGNPPSYDTLDTCARLMAQASRDYLNGKRLVLGDNVMLHKWVYATECPGETDVDWLVIRANFYLDESEVDMTPEQAGQLQFIYDHMTWRDSDHYSDFGNLVAEFPVNYPTINAKGKEEKHIAPLGERLGYIDQRMHVIEQNQAKMLKLLKAIVEK